MALTLDEEKSIEGEVGLDTLALAPAFGLAIGAAGHDTAEPFGAGLVKGWRGRVAFQALRGTLPGGVELQPVSGVVKADGQSLLFEDSNKYRPISLSLLSKSVTPSLRARPNCFQSSRYLSFSFFCNSSRESRIFLVSHFRICTMWRSSCRRWRETFSGRSAESTTPRMKRRYEGSNSSQCSMIRTRRTYRCRPNLPVV